MLCLAMDSASSYPFILVQWDCSEHLGSLVCSELTFNYFYFNVVPLQAVAWNRFIPFPTIGYHLRIMTLAAKEGNPVSSAWWRVHLRTREGSQDKERLEFCFLKILVVGAPSQNLFLQ